MLQINLIPEDARKTDDSSMEQFHRTPLMWLVIGLMLLLGVVLFGYVNLQRHRLNKLQEEIQLLQPQKTVMDQLQNFVHRLQQESSAFQLLMPQGASWTERLMLLSDLAPDGVWFTTITWDAGEGLRLEGLALQEDGTEMAKLSRFIQQFETHEKLKGVVSEVRIDTIQRTQEQDIEMVRFTITGKAGVAAKP